MATGGLSAVVDYGLLVLGMALGLASHTVAKAISWVFGTLTAYLINSRWTFQAAGSKKTLGAVVVLYGLTFALQVGTFAWAFPPLEAAWGTAVAQAVGFVIAQGVATTVNFIVQRRPDGDLPRRRAATGPGRRGSQDVLLRVDDARRRSAGRSPPGCSTSALARASVMLSATSLPSAKWTPAPSSAAQPPGRSPDATASV